VELANQLGDLASAVVGLIPEVGPECPGFAPGWGLSDQAVLLGAPINALPAPGHDRAGRAWSHPCL